MSLLTPLYLAGLALLSLPILFHLIRRTPRGQLPFSSLMFLRPSPPRLTRRSRLEHLLLLLLRAAVLCLLALAFARPFFREVVDLDVAGSRGRRVSILVDASASMRRGDLWNQAAEKVEETLATLGPTDQVALYSFETRVRPLVDFDEGIGKTPEQKAALVRQRLGALPLTWAATDLAGALITVADALDAFNDARELDAALEIVLVSDLQEGSRIENLQSYEWPANVRLTVETVTLANTTNAGVGLLAGSEEPTLERARIASSADSTRERFFVHWASADGNAIGEPLSAYVPPGESRVLRVPRPDEAAKADRVVLTGDDHDFDNTFYIAPRRRESVTVEYVGRDAADDPAGMRFYLTRALAASERYDVTIVSHSPGEAPETTGDREPRLIIVADAASEELQTRLRRFMTSGGTVLYVLKDATAARGLSGVLGTDGSPRRALHAEEAATADYSMLSEIDFGHPLFASFADPRFNDFTKIHFWKHRRVSLGEGALGDGAAGDGEEARVLARFDNEDPALIEHRVDRGRLLVLTSGWHPGDSQLALSSKFVPLLGGMLEEGGYGALDRPSYDVHDEIVLPEMDTALREAEADTPAADGRDRAEGTRPDVTARSIRRPDGSEVMLAAGARTFTETDEPGIYRLRMGETERQFAVNVSPEETRTAPLEVDQLEQYGVRLGRPAESTDERQQLRDVELEGRQKVWRWLIAGALGVLILETWLAGLLARPKKEQQA